MKSSIICIISIVVLFAASSCNEQSWLKEKPLALLTTDNSFISQSDFEAAINRIYGEVRDNIYQSDWHYTAFFNTGTDIGLRNGDGIPSVQFNDYTNLTPFMDEVGLLWTGCYQIIASANVVISRIDDPGVPFDSPDKRHQMKAEALFFRGLGYRFLVDIYGGVPLITEEVKSPLRNFTRASKDDVLNQIIADLSYAADSLPDVTQLQADGKLCKAAANHLLAEVYNTAGQYDKAIAAASRVIDNPNFKLMTTRFGKYTDKPGDVYMDLFQFGNQNRQGGLNTEAIWVCESEPDVPGGGMTPRNERYIGPAYYQIQDSEGRPLFIGPTARHGGRGISWTGITDYADSIIWEKSGWDDMRTSGYNILRDRICDNPASPYYGKSVIANNLVPEKYFAQETWNPSFLKNVPYLDYPARYVTNESTGLLSGSAGKIDPDNYIMRLAETYLLRAEAYIGNNDPIKAAEDINVVRARAHAKPVAPGDVNIDYLLDERARELIWEEPRRLVLARMGKLVDRVKQYNRLSKGSIQDFNGLWPIPYSEIENNTEATIQQNPGYTN